MKISLFLLALLILNPIQSFGNDFNQKSTHSCSSLLNQFVKVSHSKSLYKDDTIDLIWYPKAGYGFMSHYKLRVGDDLFTTHNTIEKGAHFAAAYKLANSKDGKGFFRFSLIVSDEELENIKTFLHDNEGIKWRENCTSGICTILNKTTSIETPYFFSKTPSLNATYWAVMKKFNHPKIHKIEYTGQSAIKNLMALEILFEYGYVFSGVVFTIWIINESGDLVKLLIPIHTDTDSSEY